MLTVTQYAMLAGYLPFDDDPANPEGDNINLLYKYIVSTPLTFPEYVTPHARDLLRRILVPDPRKRADLFEVARHSWLSEYAHVVAFITSSTTTTNDIANTTVPAGKHPGSENSLIHVLTSCLQRTRWRRLTWHAALPSGSPQSRHNPCLLEDSSASTVRSTQRNRTSAVNAIPSAGPSRWSMSPHKPRLREERFPPRSFHQLHRPRPCPPLCLPQPQPRPQPRQRHALERTAPAALWRCCPPPNTSNPALHPAPRGNLPLKRVCPRRPPVLGANRPGRFQTRPPLPCRVPLLEAGHLLKALWGHQGCHLVATRMVSLPCQPWHRPMQKGGSLGLGPKMVLDGIAALDDRLASTYQPITNPILLPTNSQHRHPAVAISAQAPLTASRNCSVAAHNAVNHKKASAQRDRRSHRGHIRRLA